MTPRQRYAQDLLREGFSADAAQARAVDALDAIHARLQAQPRRSLAARLGLRAASWPPVRGLYMWGGVGRGKTYLMDSFCEALPEPIRLRTHFHRFMLDVHERRRRYPDERDPLRHVADEYASEVRVLCFDEFFVSDIADAMILGRLFTRLFERGLTLIATSNIPPERLYENGLQRANFLPFIDVLCQHVDVLNVDGGTDYRLRTLTHADIYHHPSDAQAERNLEGWFAQLAPEGGRANEPVTIHGRTIRSRRLAAGVAWFDFPNLCEGPRGAADYIEIARTHHTVLLSRVPQMGPLHEDAARRFVNLVDEFYDRRVKLIIAADVAQPMLYVGEKSRFEFQRTQSRLTEMRSAEYLAEPHLP